jgi:hypothetical protein
MSAKPLLKNVNIYIKTINYLEKAIKGICDLGKSKEIYNDLLKIKYKIIMRERALLDSNQTATFKEHANG